MLLFCNNPGPSFLFGVLGNAFTERWMPWALWGVCLLSSLLVAWMLPGEPEGTGAAEMPEISLTGAMSAAMKSMASVCCWVIVFRVVIAFLQRWFLWLAPQTLQVPMSITKFQSEQRFLMYCHYWFSSVQSLSRVRLFATP